jgi:hypothetical protein
MSYLKYEEGSWTPVLRFGGLSTGITYNTQQGYYRRIGDIVFYVGFIDLSSKGSAVGNADITGLPYPNVNLSNSGGRNIVGGISNFTFTANYGVLMMESFSNQSIFNIIQQTNTSLGFLNATNTNFSNSTILLFNGLYFV